MCLESFMSSFSARSARPRRHELPAEDLEVVRVPVAYREWVVLTFAGMDSTVPARGPNGAGAGCVSPLMCYPVVQAA